MDIYTQIVDLFLSLPYTGEWGEMADLMRRSAAHKPAHWRLPLVACRAVGGTPDAALPAMTAIACAHLAILLVDDLLDADPRGVQHRLGAPAAANLAAAFQAAALEALWRGPAPLSARQAALSSLSKMLLETAYGQWLDVQNSTGEEGCWRVLQTKSAPFFRAAFHTGALLGGATDEAAGAIQQVGSLYGEMIQVHDDLNDAMQTPASPDWILGRSTLPLVFAQVVEHPEREVFLALRRRAGDPGCLQDAQAILVRCGAVSYCVDAILRRHAQARAILKETRLAAKKELQGVLDDLVRPVKALLASTAGRTSKSILGC